MFNINGIDWKVEFVSSNHPELFRSDLSKTIGSCNRETKTIYVSNNLPYSLMKKVLCHEITHAAMFSYGIILGIMEEELVADLIASYGQEIISNTELLLSKFR